MHFARPELELVNVRICKLRNFYSYRTLIDIYAFYEHSCEPHELCHELVT